LQWSRSKSSLHITRYVIAVPWFSKVYGYCTLSVVKWHLEGEARGIPLYHTRGTTHTA
jgi:hypothetical protein